MTYQTALDTLIAYEIDGQNPPDGRRVIRDARLRVMATKQTGGDVADAIKDALELLSMWKG